MRAPSCRLTRGGTVVLDRLFQAGSAIVGKMAIDQQDRVDHARDPEQQCKENVQHKLNRLPAHNYG